MKRQSLLIYISVLMLCLVLAACSSGVTLSGKMAEDGKSYSITANGTDTGDMTMSGTLIIEKNEKLVITSALEGSEAVNIYLIPSESLSADEDASVKELDEAANTQDAALAEAVTGTSSKDCFVAPGEYYVRTVAGQGMSGTVDLTVKPFDDFESWTKADSREDAAKGAGFSDFHGGVDSYTRSGITSDEAYFYQEGKAVAVLSLGDFTVYSIKSAEPLSDPEADKKLYKHSNTKDVNGVQMTMYGADEDTVSKAAWQKGEYYYNVIAFKEGDDDFGMSLAETSTIAASVD